MDEQDVLKEYAKGIAKEAYQDGGKPIVKPAGELLSLIPRAIKAALLPLEKWIVGREYNLAKTEKLLQQKLENIPPEQIEEPEAHIAVPALQYISYCMDNEELRNMYANLLASSMNKAVKNGVYPSFVEIIKQICPDEAKILRYLSVNKKFIPVITVCRSDPKTKIFFIVFSDFSNIGEKCQCEYPININIYFNNLIRLGILERGTYMETLENDELYQELINHTHIKYITNEILSKHDYNTPDYKKSFIKLSAFGESFCKICVIPES